MKRFDFIFGIVMSFVLALIGLALCAGAGHILSIWAASVVPHPWYGVIGITMMAMVGMFVFIIFLYHGCMFVLDYRVWRLEQK